MSKEPRSGRLGLYCAAALVSLAIVLAGTEVIGQLVYRATHGGWLFLEEPAYHKLLFQKHPYLIGVGRPGARVEKRGKIFSHNSMGFRGAEIASPKKAGVTRIVALGGSSTYGNGVNDSETWPHFLERELGAGYEVLNLGVPGYGTVENLIQTALTLSELMPDIALFYEGWNDIRNMNVRGLRADYSDFHAGSQYLSLRLSPAQRSGPWAAAYYARLCLYGSDLGAAAEPARLPGEKGIVDPKALNLYRRNLKSLIALSRSQGVRPVLIPQVLDFPSLTTDAVDPWTPLLSDKELAAGMRIYNDALLATAQSDKADSAPQVLVAGFERADFLDRGHFSPQGNRKFARIVAEAVKRLR